MKKNKTQLCASCQRPCKQPDFVSVVQCAPYQPKSRQAMRPAACPNRS